MRWALTQLTNEVHYWKMFQDELSAEMKYNGRAQSFRLSAGDKRLFFIERTGFLQNKYLIRTEYSQVAGEIHPGKNTHTGVVILYEKKFHYSLKNELLEVSTKKEKFGIRFELGDTSKMSTTELYALLFSSLRVMIKEAAEKRVPEMV